MSDQQVFALEVSGANLYAGGWFTTVGGAPANHIAKWDGGAWSTVGSGMDHAVWALAADGTGHLFVGGYFSLAGTNVSPFIAEANLGSAPTILRVSPTQTAEAGAPVYLTVHAAGYSPPAYQWYFNGTNLLSCTSSNLVLTNILFSQSGTYTVVVTNMFGAVTSAPVMLNVLAPVVHRLVPGVELIAPVGTFWGLDYRDNLGLTANWETMATMSLSNASQFYFDLSAPLPSQRFYRAWKSGTPSLRPSLDLHLVPAITLTGNIGDSVRVEAINQFGPIDAWFTLDTVTLTNTSQLYFDVSALGQPPRLYRLPQGEQSQIVYAAAGAVYTQNFDSLPDPGLTSVNSANPVTINGITYSLSNPFDFAFPVSTSGTNGELGLSSLAGWYGLADPTASVGTRFGATDGDQTTGGQISFGLPNSLNRALGLLATSTTGYTVFGAKFVNGTGQTLNFINLQFTGEVWRQSDTAKTLECYYFIDPSATNVFSTNATAFLPALNVSFPTVPADVGGVAVDGTSYLNQTNLAVVNQVITNWVPGAALWLVWEMADASGKSQGLAIDNLSFSASAWPTGM
jgi:hypothetical protein